MMNTWNLQRPLIVVVSAPSGAGKSTLCRRLLARFGNLRYSVSCTTRAPRGSETDGVDYHFLSAAEFDRRVAEGRFLEWADVHGHRYGTLAATVTATLESGASVLLDIDVQGAAQVRGRVAALPAGHVLRRGFVDIFLTVPSLAVLRERLLRRGEDAPAVIERRLANAAGEMARAGEFRYCVVNDELEDAFQRMCAVLAQEGGTHGEHRPGGDRLDRGL